MSIRYAARYCRGMTYRTYLLPMVIALISAFALAFAPPASAQEPGLEAIELPVGNAHAQDFAKMRVKLGVVGAEALDPEEAIARQADFAPITTPWIDFGEQDGPIWLLAKVQNPTDRAGDWVIDVQRSFVDELFVGKVKDGKIEQVLLRVNAQTPFSERPIASQYLVAPLPMEAGESAEILIGMRSSTGSWMPVTFATQERLRTAHMQEARFNWTINGAILALVIAALLMGRLVGWPLVLSFSGYAASGALFVANNEGYLHRFVLTGGMAGYMVLNQILLLLAMLAGLEFAKRFAGIPEHHPLVAKAIVATQAGLALLMIVAGLAQSLGIVNAAIMIAVPIAAAGYVAVAILAWRNRVLGAVPFLAGTIALAFTIAFMASVLAAPGAFPLTVALDYFHATLLFEAMAFFIAIMVRMLAMQRALNRSLQAEVEATREKLELANALQESRSRYDAARGAAETMRSRLRSTSHDLQQPMIALRQNLQRLADRDPDSAEKLASALDYLEQVTVTGLVEEPVDNALAGEKPDEGAETFPLSVVLDNCAAMFRGEAERVGIDIIAQATTASVHSDPVALMRSVSNLVSNALKHSGGSQIELLVEESDAGVELTVADNGRGMSKAEIAAFSQADVKGEDSDGHGLGLALVHEFANAPGRALRISSAPGEGARFTLVIPKGRE